ncbi:hypothetical protein CLV78_102266 [Aliiruegeria haliotis]|uniref:VOC domain-containing protein n=1 Tax=Aliiruegeria haliotis TaxID=1280846 RepID=A0A2T0RV61_9RHOB|nr:VOC family protein [Aliiruegeria haliotis]PRY25089.1 hypothetical protein CLV78_102266 [Aliiruegeria haliotis]
MTYRPENATVWIEIPVTDLDKAMEFYSATTGMALNKVTDMEPNPIAMFVNETEGKGVAGHLYPGKPAGDGSGPTVHLATPGKLEATMDRVKEAGGTGFSPIITIPPGRFFYCQDPDGNSVSFFETDPDATYGAAT